jgi:serine/threonine protein kinase
LDEHAIGGWSAAVTPERWAQVKEIFAGAFPLPPDRRSAFLDGACGGDAALRSEVERLLAGSEEPSWPSPLHPTIAPGDSLAHFRIESRLGEGGMGVVYRAFDTRLQRTVALKVLPPEYAGDSGWKQRLMREARAASALNHPNIVTVYEIGSEGVVDFISMEYVEGRPLSQRIREKGLSQQEALHYALLIADALAMAHAAGVVHRDLKPANIMVTPDGRIKLLDFGLARQTKSADGATVTTTKLGEIAGTPYYMSPEQARGLQVDARTDIFSLGVVLYEMLTGRRPFEGDTASHAMLCIVEKAPTPLPAGTPAELQRIAGKMLEKDPAQRYQTAKDVATDLKRLNAQAASSNKGRRRMVLISIAAAVLGAAALFAYLRQTPALTSKDTILLADFVNTTGDSVFDDTLKQGLGAQLEQSPYISLLAEEQVRETLGYMGRAPGERITHQIGREICQRRGAKALIEGSIAPLGRTLPSPCRRSMR